MPYDPKTEPWRTARALLEEFGDGAPDEIWRRTQELVRAGQDIDAPGLVAVMQAVRALSGLRNPNLLIN